MGKWAIALAVAAATVAGPVTASASVDQYTPSIPPGSSLAGSTIVTECSTGEPRITFAVRLARPAAGSDEGDPGSIDAEALSDPADPMEASLIVASPRRSATVGLGTVVADEPARTIAWPAALDPIVDDLRPGEALSATLVVSPEMAPPLRVPLSAEPCAADPAVASLPVTGGSAAGLIGIGAAAAAAIAVGGVLVARRRQHR